MCVEYNDGVDALAAVAASLPARPPNPTPGELMPVYFDIIFIDCQMSIMDGPEAVEKMRKGHGYKGLIYGISGDARAADTFKEAGANGAYTKPMKNSDLKFIVECMYFCTLHQCHGVVCLILEFLLPRFVGCLSALCEETR